MSKSGRQGSGGEGSDRAVARSRGVTGRPRRFDRASALERAKTMFWSIGYTGTSVAALTKELGISAPSLYAAFGDKDELFAEVLQSYVTQDTRALLESLDSHADVVRAFDAFFRTAVGLYAGDPLRKGCLIVTGAINCAPEQQKHVDLLRMLRGTTFERIKSRLFQALRDGQLLADTDLNALAQFFQAFLNGLALRARDGVEADALMSSVDHALLPLRSSLRSTANF